MASQPFTSSTQDKLSTETVRSDQQFDLIDSRDRSESEAY